MTKVTSKAKNFIWILLVLFCFLFILNNFINFTTAQINGESPPINLNFEMTEYANLEENINNVSLIEIPLNSSKWDLTDIELNFTNIEFKREIKEVESNIIGHSRELDKGDKAYAVQINITEPTDVFGVQIYGYESRPATTTIITVQINGYDNPTNKPNETVYRSVALNMSSETKWYSQTFNSTVHLTKGYYYLIMNGSEMGPSDSARYYWEMNDENPNNPNLFSWGYEADWVNGITNETLLYKLDQRITKEVFPEEINMSAELDESYYPILNGSSSGIGYLNLNLNYSLNTDVISIPIKNNLISDLAFNVNYSINLRNSFLSEGSVLITDSNNEWNIYPEFSRFSSNYSVKYEYSGSWQNLTIYRDIGTDWENITSYIIIDSLNHFILLPNDIIIEGADWKITANSPNIDFEIKGLFSEYKPEQDLQFSVEVPIIQGNLTFILIKPGNFIEIIELNREVTSDEILFSFVIPSSFREGEYTIEIYWNDETDAGVQSQEFQIIVPSVPFTLDPLTIFGIVLLVVVFAAFSIISYRTIKKVRTRKIEEKQKIFSKCMDIMNLDYLIVTNKISGLSVYEQKFTSKQLNGTLISGFLQALSSFGIELMKVENQSQTIKLEYKDSIVLMSEFVNVRLILIMKESPSKYLLYSLEDLAYDIYKNYGNLIDQFDGDVRKFKGIENLLIKHLNIAIVYPLRLVDIDKLENIRVSPTEKSFINDAISIMNKDTTDFFYIKDLIIEKTCSPKDIELILKLIEKNIFQAAV